ncbi:Bug family tripartite tricarboxylate transporter substrate binding protein [Halalkalibacterium ligniniphilum]|uniref:Bug family tripartite tricarboxylate transporter substrate binding protein n=1 Tax=Halalkalibacterium ligniniphilum TaxID=1134413 RepID=UPI0003494C3C|nr:tripartite tricarboxylate transporter substrate binding protein [Halalkalibacterium ligniniphilum]
MYLKKSVLLLALTAIMILSACSNSSSGEGEAVSFPNENITYVVPYGAGGGFDSVSRMISPFWEETLPGDVNIVVDNRPGGGGNTGLGTIYNAEPDGHTVGILNLPGDVVNQLLDQASYDLNEFEYIGRMSDTYYIAATPIDSEFNSLEDVQNAEGILVGTAPVSSTAGLGAVLASETLGFDATIVPHPDSSEALLSALQGNVDLVQFPYNIILDSVLNGDLKPLWVYADERHPELPDVPTIAELGYPDLLESVIGQMVLVTTPGVPEETLDVLRESFYEAHSNPDFQEQLLETGDPGTYADHEESAELSRNALEQFEPLTDIIRSYQ